MTISELIEDVRAARNRLSNKLSDEDTDCGDSGAAIKNAVEKIDALLEALDVVSHFE